ncbi:hypothetical protein F53441_14206 [Fusarium austroafricanum]|uniref:DUF7600 domain-containing protein n=1 Tax=Fusarium austroafricanum TaxID=2364996 RepID=A0A8H4JIQ1_9HYPO|nr:hypothetical protein F53441_14206 [Fusarium austroafricanum]
MNYCTLCGIPITRKFREQWLQEFRVVWIESDHCDQVSVSGVGRCGSGNNEFFGTVPDDPKKRYDDQAGPGTTIVVALTPVNPIIFTRSLDEDASAWGYGFHASCWAIFTKHATPNLVHLFAACLSMPTGQEAFLNWGHDYGGAGTLEKRFEVPTRASSFSNLWAMPDDFRMDPFDIPSLANAIQRTARLQNDVFLSHVNFSDQSLGRDPFSRLLPEILQSVTLLLSTSDIRSVRLASPVFASLELTERFWASRFQPGHEFEHIYEVQGHPPESWRALCLSLQTWALSDPSMANRKRVWRLSANLHGILSQMEDAPCRGNSVKTWFESSVDLHKVDASWNIAACAITEPNGSFTNGCRVLRARTLSLSQTLKVQHMSVSFVNIPEGTFVSGLVLVDHNDEHHSIGYIHEDSKVDIRLATAKLIHGWELGFHSSGVKAVALIFEDGTSSSWAGNPAGLGRWRLAGASGVSAIEAEFDALKLVRLCRKSSLTELSWLNNCLWYPHVPSIGLTFHWSKDYRPPTQCDLPVTTLFFGENDDRYLSTLTEIVISVFDICHIAGMEFRFADASHNRHLGSISPFNQGFPQLRKFNNSNDNIVSFAIDSAAGERLESFDVQRRGGLLVGLKIKTTHNRHVQTPDYPYGTERDWTTVHPKGSKIIGMFATCGHVLWDLGFISKDSVESNHETIDRRPLL